jgi:hypothetical protein
VSHVPVPLRSEWSAPAPLLLFGDGGDDGFGVLGRGGVGILLGVRVAGVGGECRSGSSLPPSHVLDVEVETSAVDNVLMHAQTLAMHIQTNAPALPGRLSRLSER